ncbi:hypothetical protein ONS96_005557 [Cadophora gregata f. sp. sojae]|nr:hypothetical protein ONS96_005557 [Cadophora gregata f. sp. sojae]
MFVPINRTTSAPRDPQTSRSPVAATMDVASELLSPKTESPRTKGPSWTDDDKEKYQEIISSIGSTAGEAGAPTSYAQLFDLASQRLADLGITKSSTQCKDKWYRMSNRAENESLFNFTRGRSKHGTFGEDKLEVEEPEDLDEGLDSSFVGDEGFTNGDDNIDGEGATSTSHRNLVRWEDRERDALVEVVKERRELERSDNSQPEFNSGQLFEWASSELQRRYGIDRTKSSCMIFWRRNIAGTCGFGSGNESTKLVATTGGRNSIAKPFDDTPTMTLRETPTKSKRLQNSLHSQPQPQAEPPSPKAPPRAQSPKLGRKFTPAQKAGLAREAENGLNPDAETRARLVQELGLTGQQVSGYFGNARFKARKAELKLNGTKDVGGEEAFDSEEPSLVMADITPDIGVKTRRSRKRKRSSMVSLGSDDEPLVVEPSVKQSYEPAADVDVSPDDKIYGSRPGMLKRKAPMRDPSLPLLPPPSYEDSMLKASPNPYGSPLNPPPPHLSRPRQSEPPRSSSSRLSLDPTNSSLREASNVPSTAPTSSTSANTSLPNAGNVPADDQLMESILATKVSSIDEEMASLMRKSEEESAAIQNVEAEINEFDRRIREIQDQKDVAVTTREQKQANLSRHAGRIQILGNRKAQIAKALTDLKAAISDEV